MKSIKKYLINILWRTKFEKVRINYREQLRGRCLECAGNDECSKHYCPCKYDEQLLHRKY